MSTQAWIFLVGLRVFDVGALVIWLVWFCRLRDDSDGQDDDGPGGPPERGPSPGGSPGPGSGLPLPDAAPWSGRRRDHAAPARVRAARREPHEWPRPGRTVPSRRG